MGKIRKNMAFEFLRLHRQTRKLDIGFQQAEYSGMSRNTKRGNY